MKATEQHRKAAARRAGWMCRAQAGELLQVDCDSCSMHRCHDCGSSQLEEFWHVYCRECRSRKSNVIYPARQLP